jgi:hypothetical protein
MKRLIAVTLVLLGLAGPAAADEMVIRGKVVDVAGKPAAGVELATFWIARDGAMTAYQGVTSGADGGFSLKAQFYGRPVAVLGLDKERKTGGLIEVKTPADAKDVTLDLQPLVRVKGDFFCKELNSRPPWTNVYMITAGGARPLQCDSQQAKFSFLLPPGTYKFNGYGSDVQDHNRELKLSKDQPEIDLKTIDLAATPIARSKGKAPPAWNVTDARGVKKDVTLADFKGKWVMVEFWGFW